MWCFGSMRMFLAHAPEFSDWRLSQDVIWEKHNGSGFAADRFKRVHEIATHWYRGEWADAYHETPKTLDATKRAVRRKERPTHMGEIADSTYSSEDGGPRLTRSVIYCRSMHGRALHPTEKPSGILEPLMEYGCPPGGTILDPSAGSSSTLAAAKGMGLRAVGIEADERYCEIAAKRLAQHNLFGGVA
jgi:site-specific DNA-methyltransferase (adenine-specific)